MKFNVALSFILILLLIGCNAVDDLFGNLEDDIPPVENIDISGVFEGRVSKPTRELGNVLYSFEKIVDNIYRGYYEGIEFGEITVTGSKFEGLPSAGNTAFSSLNGSMEEGRLSFSGYNSSGGHEFSFSGLKKLDGNRTPIDVVISGRGYVLNDSYCTYGGLYYSEHEFVIQGDLDFRIDLVLVFENIPTSGTYSVVESGPFTSSTMTATFYTIGGVDDANYAKGGSATVSVQGSNISVVLDDIVFDPIVNFEGSILCEN